MSENLTANCPFCDKPARLIEREYRIRRGERVLPVQLPNWECQTGCLNEAGTGPFRFANMALAPLHAALTEAAWLAAFGEPLPAAKPPGRKPREKRTVDVHLLLTPSEAAWVDRMRAERSRAEFIREKLLAGYTRPSDQLRRRARARASAAPQ